MSHKTRKLGRRTFLGGAAGVGAAALVGSRLELAGAQSATPAVNSDVSGKIRYQLVASVADEINAAQKLIDGSFKQMFPNIDVSVEPTPDKRDEKLIASMVAGNAPDVIDTWRDDVIKYADRGQILDVGPYVDRDLSAADVADFHQWQWNDFVLPSGIRFGMPKYVNLMVLWYNKDLLAKVGVNPPDDSWDHTTYADAAIKLTEKNGDEVDRFGLFYPAYSLDRFSYKLEAFGGGMVDPSDNTKPTFDNEPSQAAEEWMRKLIWDDRAAADRDSLFPGGDGLAATLDAFASERVAMVEDGFYPFSIAEAIGDKFKVGFAAVPKGPVKRRVLGTADGFAIWKGSKSQDAAWELLKFLSGPEYQTQLVALTGYLPNRASVLSQWKKVVTDKYPQLADSGLDVGPQAMQEGYPGNRPLFKKDAEAQQIIAPALQKVYITGGTDVSYFTQVAEDVAKSQQG